MKETIRAVGHEHVQATHDSTLEITTDPYLTEAGDCIIAIEADTAPADFDDDFVEACQHPSATITITLDVGGLTDRIEGRGDPALTFTSDRSAVVRTSGYIDDRTVCVDSDGAAGDVDRHIVERLSAGDEVTVTLSVHP